MDRHCKRSRRIKRRAKRNQTRKLFLESLELRRVLAAPSISVDAGDSDTETLVESSSGLSVARTLTFSDTDIIDSVSASVDPNVTITGDDDGIGSSVLIGMMSVDPTTVFSSPDTSGQATWTFDSGSETFDHLAGGEQLILEYNIVATDLLGETDTHPVTVTINGTDDNPDITIETGDSDEETLTESDSGLSISGTLTVTDLDKSDTVDVNKLASINVTGTDGQIGNTALLNMVTLNNVNPIIDNVSTTGLIQWSFDSGAEAFDHLSDGESVTMKYRFRAQDASVPVDDHTLTITVTGTNDAPEISGSATTASLTETGSQITSTGMLNVVDVDTDDTVTVSVDSVSVNGSSTFSGVNPLSQAAMLGMMAVSPTTAVPDIQHGTDLDFDWTFTSDSNGDGAFDFLGVGETLVLDYVIQAQDDSGVTVGESTTDTQVVTVTITGANQDPVIGIADLVGTATEDASSPSLTDSGTIEFTDNDHQDTHVASATFDSTTHSAQLGSLSASVTTDSTGTGTGGVVTWNYSVANSDVQFLGAGESISETYVVSLDDQEGGVVNRDVVVTITGDNDTPTILIGDPAGGVTEDASTPNLTDSGTISFADVDLTDTHTSSTTFLASTHSSQLGALTSSVTTATSGGVGGTATWDYSVANSAVQFLGAGETIEETYRVDIVDNSGTGNDTVSQTVTVTITGSNDQPTVTVGDIDGAVTEDASTPNLTDTGSISFAEIDDNDVITSSVSKIAETTGGGAVVSSALSTALESAVAINQIGGNDGTIGWTFTLANSLAQYLADGESVTAHYSIEVQDDSGSANDTVSQSISITITGTNDRPDIASIDSNGTVTEDASTPNVTDTGGITFAEVDDSDTVSSAVVKSGESSPLAIPMEVSTALDTAVTLNQIGTNDGTADWTFTLDNSLIQYLGAGEFVSAFYNVTVTDDSGQSNNSNIESMAVTVNGVNDQPTIAVVDVIGAVIEDASTPNLTDTGSVTFDEVDQSDVITSSVAKSSESTSSSAAIPAALTTALDSAVTIVQTGGNDGTIDWTFELDNDLVQYLADGETVTAVYTITVQDDSGAANDTATEDVTVTITGTNDQPTVTVGDISGSVTEDASTPNLTDTGSISFTEVDDTDIISSTVSKIAETTSGGAAVSSALSTALDSAVALAQSGNNDGTIDWTFTLDNDLVQYLSHGQSVTAHYSIDVKDDSGTATDTFSQSMSVTIEGTNDQPVITIGDVNGAVVEDASTPNLTDNGSVTFAEVDDSDILTSSVAKTSESTTSSAAIPTALTAALNSAITLNQTGTNDGTIDWSFTLDNDLVQYLADGEEVSAVYTITVDDGSAQGNATATQDVTVTITGTNDQPQVTVGDITGASHRRRDDSQFDRYRQHHVHRS